MESYEEVIASVLDVMRRERKYYKNFLSQAACNAGIQLCYVMHGAGDELKNAVLELFKKEMPVEHPYMAVWWYSVLIEIKKSAPVFYDFVRYVRENKEAFSKNTLDFLYYQFAYLYDSNPSLYDESTKLELWKLFLEIVETFASETTVSLKEIPETERDQNLVLVIIIQYIPVSHAPTVTALDRGRILMERCGKKVLMINTGEAANSLGCIPFMESIVGHNQDLSTQDTVNWKETSIPYFQCSVKMPDMDVINLLLDQIRNMAPRRVVLIGGSSILGNLINRMIPALTISTGFSDLAITGTRYQAVGRKLTQEDESMLKNIGYDRTHVIESTFTFDMKPQTEKISRQELGIPEDAFVMAVVGMRLNMEMTDEFLQTLEHIMDETKYVLFVGDFSAYNERVKAFPVLFKQSKAPGACNDVLSRLKVCDLYVNPKRKGGGSSVVEAMYLGKPAVSFAYGDVALNAGEEFCVDTYEEMEKQIKHYCNDKEFYTEMSEKARKRVDIFLDTERAFREIMEEYDRREKERAFLCKNVFNGE